MGTEMAATGSDNYINPRYNGGKKEGSPGDVIMVTLSYTMPPKVLYGGVQADGYFSDEFYDKQLEIMESADRKKLRKRL